MMANWIRSCLHRAVIPFQEQCNLPLRVRSSTVAELGTARSHFQVSAFCMLSPPHRFHVPLTDMPLPCLFSPPIFPPPPRQPAPHPSHTPCPAPPPEAWQNIHSTPTSRPGRPGCCPRHRLPLTAGRSPRLCPPPGHSARGKDPPE